MSSADKTKLDGIETGATADQTKADIDALNINADQVDGLEASVFARSDESDSLSGDTYAFDGSSNLKILLSGASSPRINPESTTDKAQISWQGLGGALELKNFEDDSAIRIKMILLSRRMVRCIIAFGMGE